MNRGPINELSVATASIGVVGILSIAMASAQSPPRDAEVARGAVIAAQGSSRGAPACAQCHAFNGSSDGSGAFPRLAGQSVFYLSKQLDDFTTGVRANAVMSPIAKLLTPGEKAEAAAYYAGVDGAFLPLADVDAALFKRGEKLATIGDEGKSLQACNSCHGPGGVGQPPAIPYLAGQYAHYISVQLEMWRRGFRKNGHDTMRDIAKRLDENDIAAVSAYFQQVRLREFAKAEADR